ncbi:MAG: response regulator [Lachnospiraceae bacterium]|nr:response regulator [Lachnospiraceae bacterium]MBR1875862.1 response regulator [Lachnospiraceae bacterium]
MDRAEIKVLLCDDSLLARKNMTDKLNACGITKIMMVNDGQSAVDTYKAERPDIIFLDIVMPVKDGITALKEIIEFDKNAYAVMVSSAGTQVHIREAIKCGAKDFLQKPAALEQVQTIIDHVLNSD